MAVPAIPNAVSASTAGSLVATGRAPASGTPGTPADSVTVTLSQNGLQQFSLGNGYETFAASFDGPGVLLFARRQAPGARRGVVVDQESSATQSGGAGTQNAGEGALAPADMAQGSAPAAVASLSGAVGMAAVYDMMQALGSGSSPRPGMHVNTFA